MTGCRGNQCAHILYIVESAKILCCIPSDVSVHFVLFLFLATTSKISRVLERMAGVSRNQSRQNPWTSGLDWEVSSERLIHPWRPKPGTATKPSSRRRPWQDSRRCPSYTVFSIPLSHFVVCLHFFLQSAHCFACAFS